MKIIIFTVDHIYANKVVKDLIQKFDDEIIYIVESESLLPKKNKLQALKKYFVVSGFYYVYIQIIKLEIYKLLSKFFTHMDINNPKFYSYKKTASIKNIKLISRKDVNSEGFVSIIRRKRPDLIVSVFFNQILSDKIIRLPQKGVINIHPAYLPDYKGVSPVFWALSNSEKYTGISVHYINAGIDTGKIIARKKLLISKNDTEHSLYWKLCEIGSPMLVNSISKLSRGRVKTIQNRGGRYFSIPTKSAVDKYLKKHKFFYFKNYIFG